MKSSYNKRDREDLRRKVIERELITHSNYSHYPFYTASGSKTQSVLEEPPESCEISGEYFEANPEIIDVAFSHQVLLNTRELLGRGVCTQIIDKHQEQTAYKQHIYHRPTLW